VLLITDGVAVPMHFIDKHQRCSTYCWKTTMLRRGFVICEVLVLFVNCTYELQTGTRSSTKLLTESVLYVDHHFSCSKSHQIKIYFFLRSFRVLEESS